MTSPGTKSALSVLDAKLSCQDNASLLVMNFHTALTATPICMPRSVLGALIQLVELEEANTFHLRNVSGIMIASSARSVQSH